MQMRMAEMKRIPKSSLGTWCVKYVSGFFKHEMLKPFVETVSL